MQVMLLASRGEREGARGGKISFYLIYLKALSRLMPGKKKVDWI